MPAVNEKPSDDDTIRDFVLSGSIESETEPRGEALQLSGSLLVILALMVAAGVGLAYAIPYVFEFLFQLFLSIGSAQCAHALIGGCTP
ncbi:hypothetical protein GCM10010988_40580 [Cnuibacter physcomitrellae]|uniref:Uncharacterized protein n=1 Tax=Cnuibacter physcomitrellae TaxID=1619308 RepID=A0A1X9LR18_9MICO|nr:hypothetical protein [Cnuibacter physcomitrellae]ARJ07626.1 hypothetical protein B5808_19805 [Cnuibacter physcomitrellae]GGI42746.1 hypothetical protein GCM10010988_40580 [Cnuibacter physcomitrellae]